MDELLIFYGLGIPGQHLDSEDTESEHVASFTVHQSFYYIIWVKVVQGPSSTAGGF